MNVSLGGKRCGVPLLLFAVLGFVLVIAFLFRFESIFAEKAIHAAEESALTIINTASERTFCATCSSEFVNISRDNSGKITSVSANTAEINRLKSKFAAELQDACSEKRSISIFVPVGSLTGISALQGVGIKLPVKIYADSLAAVDFKDEFTDAGINQVKHKINMTVSVKMSIVSAIMSKSKTVCTEVPVAETVILGNVPNYFGENLHVIGR